MQCIVESCGIWRVLRSLCLGFSVVVGFSLRCPPQGPIGLARGCIVRGGGSTERDHSLKEIRRQCSSGGRTEVLGCYGVTMNCSRSTNLNHERYIRVRQCHVQSLPAPPRNNIDSGFLVPFHLNGWFLH